MLKRYFLNNKKRNFSTASIWIKGGSDADSVGKKGITRSSVHYLPEDVRVLIISLFRTILSPMEHN